MTQVLHEEYDVVEREQQGRNEARHIKNNVDKARKDHHVSGERWPFELLQNAHDTGPREGLKRVNVTIEWKSTFAAMSSTDYGACGLDDKEGSG